MNLPYFSVFMNLFKRFLFFFFGLAIGSVFVMFFFQRKGTEFCYLPNCRVLKDLRSKPLALADSLRDYSVEQLAPLELTVESCTEKSTVKAIKHLK